MENVNFAEVSSYVTLLQFIIWSGWGIAGIIVTRFFWKLKSRKRRFRKVYFPSDAIDFYTTFSRAVRGAKETIRNSGDGFMLSNPASLKNANTLDAAFCAAMDNGVKVSRFQITGSAPLSWYSRLYALKKKYPNNFHVYTNENYNSMGSFCVIDQGLRETVYEHQIVSGSIVGRGTEPVEFTFVYGHQSKSNNAAELFDRAVQDIKTIELELEDIEALQRNEWKRALERISSDPSFTVIDPEVLDYIKSGKKSKEFPRAAFINEESKALNFIPNWD